MNNILGDVVEMDTVGEDDVNISALDDVESTIPDDITKDYATGYVAIIQRLIEVTKNTSATNSVMVDVKNMVIDIAHNVSALTSKVETLQQENGRLKEKIHNMSETQSTLLTRMSIHSGITDDIVETEAASATHTRQVSSTVPACIIRSFWQKHSNTDMGVSMKYLRSVCDVIFPKLQPVVKSNLGISLSRHMDNYEDRPEAGVNMIMVLCGSQESMYADGRAAIIKTMKLLGTRYAFMIPRTLATLLSRTETMGQQSIMLLRAPRTSDMIGAGEGYDVIAEKLMDQPKVRKGLKILHDTDCSTATLKKFIKSIASGTLDAQGKMRAPHTNSLVASTALFPTRAEVRSPTGQPGAKKVPGVSKFSALKRG